MAAKDPVMNLIDFRAMKGPEHEAHDFKIESLKNTTQHTAGCYIQKQVVDDLINVGWAVNIRQPRNSDFT